MNQEEVAALRPEAEAELKKYRGVVGVSYGYKERGGKVTDELALRVYVTEKGPAAELASEDLIPREYKGVPTDVLNVLHGDPLQTSVCEDKEHHMPLVCGMLITNGKVQAGGKYSAGTLGFFATNGGNPPKNIVLVSNNHVFFDPGVKVGDPINQAYPDQTSIAHIENAGMNGAHSYQYPGESADTFFVDAATARLDIDVCSTTGHTIKNCGVSFANRFRVAAGAGQTQSPIAGVGRAQSVGDIVSKAGASTGRTVGKVRDPNGVHGDGSKMIIIDPTQRDCNNKLQFAIHGDSGAAVLNDKNELIGIVAEGDPTHPGSVFACHIAPVLDTLNVVPITAKHLPTGNPAFDASAVTPAVAAGGGAPVPAPMVFQRFLATDEGRRMSSLVEENRPEVAYLLNHCRPVTVAWHRGKGPRFIDEAAINYYDPKHPIPREIDGVTREMLIQRMADLFTKHGSERLRAIVDRWRDEALAHGRSTDSLHDLIRVFSAADAT